MTSSLVPVEKKPKVTVLMPIFNCEKFLSTSIGSVLNQTYRDFELLIINDGSTDDSESIILSYHDPRIKYFKQENMGVSRSLNNGLSLAAGEYIRRHDADDYSEPDMLKKQMNFLAAHPAISFVSTQCAFMSVNGKVASHCRQPKDTVFGNDPFIIAERKNFNPYSPIVHGTVLGPTSVFREMNGYRTEFLTSEDNDLWLRIMDKYKFAILNDCPYFLRISEGSATKMHKTTVRFYRDLALVYASERAVRSTDPLMRGEKIPPPIEEVPDANDQLLASTGRLFRSDLLNYTLQIVWDAKDWKEIWALVKYAIRDGWRLSATWKRILFTILGEKNVAFAVSVKKKFQK
jgi:glycosyltransferase involved in cell wall biosynthesis